MAFEIQKGVQARLIDGEAIVISFLNGRYYSASGYAADILNALSKGPLSKEDALAWLEPRKVPTSDQLLEAFWKLLLAEGIIISTDAPSAPENLSRSSEDPSLYFETHTELADVITLDPVHEVSPEGWPHKAAT